MSAALLAAAGCVGAIGDAGSGGGSDGAGGAGSGAGATSDGGASAGSSLDAPTRFTCDPSRKGAVDTLRALSTAQYTNTLRDLTAWAMNDPAAGAALLTEISTALASIPPNVPVVPADDALATTYPEGGWLRADQAIQYSRVAAFYSVGVAVGGALTAPARFGTVVGSCATDSDPANDAACLSAFLQRFGPRALRRPLTAADVATYTAIYGATPTADPAAYADVIAVMLDAPEFLYLVEHGDAAAPAVPGVYPLTAYELASRLAYHAWDTMPDDELWNAAVDGSLLQSAVYQKEASRLFADRRAQATLHRFFEDYLQVNGTGGPRGTGGLNHHDLTSRNGEAQFMAFAGSDLPTPQLYSNMVADSLAMLDYYTWTVGGTVHDLLTSDLSFAQTADVAKLYGLPVWDGASPPPSFPPGQRPGLFTRALSVAGGLDSKPILKGVFLRRYLLCDTIGPPPPGAAAASIPITTTETTRQATEAVTSVSPCSGCHTSWLNPLGFASENFDGLGRLRTAQTLYDDKGAVATSLPINTQVVPYVAMGDGVTQAAGMSTLMSIVEASDKPAACLARNYFRYTFGRFEDLSRDGCTLEPVRAKLDGGGRLADMFQAVVSTPAFKQRTFE